jgi:hypothetical protein
MDHPLSNLEFECYLQEKVLSALSEAGLFANGALMKDKVFCKMMPVCKM